MAKRGATPEREWQNTLVSVLELFGYVVEHTYPLLTRPRAGGQPVWRTGSTLKGKPDLIAVRPPRLLAIECKRDGENPTAEQVAVLTLYAAIPCARAWVLRPGDPWTDIQAWIRRPVSAPHVYGFTPMADHREAVAVIDRSRRRNRDARPATR